MSKIDGDCRDIKTMEGLCLSKEDATRASPIPKHGIEEIGN